MGERIDVAVVGGGPGGLAAAALLAKAGKRVRVFERASHAGGRARSSEEGELRLNFGPHALYLGGPAEEVLRSLGAMPSGHAPVFAGPRALVDGTFRPLPLTAGGLLTTPWLSWRERLQLARALPFRAPAAGPLDRLPLREWLDRRGMGRNARLLLEGLLRVATYAADFDRLSTGTALRQLARANRPGVVYVDGGWSSIVDNLARAAISCGADVRAGRGVTRVSRIDDGWRIESKDSAIDAGACVLAGGPSLLSLVDGANVAVSERLRPVHAACLDVVLSSLPDPRADFAVGLDEPLYFSVHTRAPGGVALHVAKYLADESDAAEDERRLESLLDALQPGWRERIVTRRFLPKMVVSHALPEAAFGGESGRPGVVVDAAGLYVVGDWVGGQAHLLDASLASARACAEALARPSVRAAA